MSNNVCYYFLAPTWHNHPGSGTLQLGNVITDLQTPEQPVHRGPPPPPPKTLDVPPEPGAEEQTISWQTDYNFSIDDLKAGKLGLWTKFLSVLRLGVDLGYEWDQSTAQRYTFKRLETREFVPSQEYIQACLQAPPVARLIARKKRVLYIVTGIKAVTGASASSSADAGRKVTADVEVDASVAGGVPVSLGPEAQRERKRREGVSWDGSSDFVFAYRVQRIAVSRGGLAAHDNHRKAAMLGQEEAGRADEGFVLCAPDEGEVTNGGFEMEESGGGELCAVPRASGG